MNRIRQRSCSPYDWKNQVLTDRSQNQYTHRNSNSQLLDTTAHKNVSQTIRKEERKSQQSKVMQRKKSVSSYYFQNIKKGHLKNDQTLVNNPNNKNPPTNSQRNRCQTSCNITTNKIDKQSQQVHQTCIIYVSPQTCCQPSKSSYFCINHPKKIAYFEQQSSQVCYCHECSIQNVKKNKRLIQLTPEITQVKRLISKKIVQTQSYGEELCSQIHRVVQKSVQQFQQKYRELKRQFAQTLSSQHQHHQSTIDFELKQIDWSFLKHPQMVTRQVSIQPFKFLNPNIKKYKIVKTPTSQIPKKNILEKSPSQLSISPIRKKEESVEKVLLLSECNETDVRSKNLLKEIEKALNCQPRNPKLKVKKVNLLCFQQKKQSQNQNKENISPNYQN